MYNEADEEILQDFLIEAGEILESLSEQLVELENDPDNADLLNAIFRGFHTVKGGAGFLSLTNLVDACHGAENVFDILRNNQRSVTPELMDVILKSLDTINDMFAQVQNREEIDVAAPELLAELHRLSIPEAEEESAAPVAQATAPADDVLFDADDSGASSSSSDEMTEDEFEALLDELHGANSPSAPAVPVANKAVTSSGDEISDDEFESLLDELHGQGAFNTKNATPAAKSNSDEINDDEFESLLDELHGKGQSPQSAASTPKVEKPKEQPKPAPVAKAAAPVSKPAEKKAPAKKATDKKSSPTECTTR
jgi:two-component system chemotaxis sensor kinase CheA